MVLAAAAVPALWSLTWGEIPARVPEGKLEDRPSQGTAPRTSTVDGRAVAWPPRVGERYPDLELIDGEGRPVRLSQLEGKVLLLEPIGMNCPACQALAASKAGASLGGVTPQGGLPPIEETFGSYTGGLSLGDPRIVYVQLLLYDLGMEAPDAEDVRLWQEAFPTSLPNRLVLAPARDMRSPASYALVPGFQLVDRSFLLQVDAAGHQPRHDLYRELLPRVKALCEAARPAEAAPASAASTHDAARVAAAYEAIPHRQTTYRAGDSPLPAETARSLERLLLLVDEAVALRVETLRSAHAADRRRVDDGARKLEALDAAIAGLELDASAAGVAKLVRDALGAQRAYFREWLRRLDAGQPFSFDAADPNVGRSSQCLRKAYAELMRLYPGETGHNRQAFFDHLCALDFV